MSRLAVGRRSLALILALLLAAVASMALVSYVRGVEARALEDVEQVEVLVARAPVPAGTTVEDASTQGLVARQTVARKLAPEGAVGSLEQIEGRVAAVDLVPGETLVSARFVQPSQARGLLDIPEGRHAMSVEVGVPPGVAGFIEAGDIVSLIAALETPGAPAGAPLPGEQPGSAEGVRVAYLLHNVPVLSVGQRIVTTNQEQADGSQVQQSQERVLMTLALTPNDAEKLAYAIFEGNLYVTLVPPEQEAPTTPGRTRDTIWR